MLEYVFFDARPREQFVEFVSGKGLAAMVVDTDECLMVQLEEGLDDDLEDEIENFYDRMMDYDRSLKESDDTDGYKAAGIVLDLQGGQTAYAAVDPDLLGRVMGAISAEEFARIVDAIVTAVENPDSRSMCQRMREDDQ